MAHRYFLSETDGTTAYVRGDEAKHLALVMRAKKGDSVILCDNLGYDYDCIIADVAGDVITCDILSRQKNAAQPTKALTVFMALPKSDKLELIVQKCCELGAERLVPFVSEWCVAQISKNEDKKTERYNRISTESAKQCGRSIPMVVENAITFRQLLSRLGEYDKKLLFYEHGEKRFSDMDLKNCRSVCVIVGSEGGFSEKEVTAMCENGAENIVLGQRILRCETAAIAATTLAMYEMGEME